MKGGLRHIWAILLLLPVFACNKEHTAGEVGMAVSIDIEPGLFDEGGYYTAPRLIVEAEGSQVESVFHLDVLSIEKRILNTDFVFVAGRKTFILLDEILHVPGTHLLDVVVRLKGSTSVWRFPGVQFTVNDERTPEEPGPGPGPEPEPDPDPQPGDGGDEHALPTIGLSSAPSFLLNNMSFAGDFTLDGYDKTRHDISVTFDGVPLSWRLNKAETILSLRVQMMDLSVGNHLFVITVSDRTSGKSASFEWPLTRANFNAYLEADGQRQENNRVFLSSGLSYNVCVDLDVPCKGVVAYALLPATGRKQYMSWSSDGRRATFSLSGHSLPLGESSIEIHFVTEDERDIYQVYTIRGYHRYIVSYTLSGNALYGSIMGPTNSLQFPIHFGMSLFLRGVIPYTNAVIRNGEHVDEIAYEYRDIESAGFSYDFAAGEAFSTKCLYSSSYMSKMNEYLRKELGKISASHTSSRWKCVNGTWEVEFYYPQPYLQGDVLLFETYDSTDASRWCAFEYDVEVMREYFTAQGIKIVVS